MSNGRRGTDKQTKDKQTYPEPISDWDLWTFFLLQFLILFVHRRSNCCIDVDLLLSLVTVYLLIDYCTVPSANFAHWLIFAHPENMLFLEMHLFFISKSNRKPIYLLKYTRIFLFDNDCMEIILKFNKCYGTTMSRIGVKKCRKTLPS